MKTLAAILIIVMLFSLAACKLAEKKGAEVQPEPAPSTAEGAASDVEADITGLDALSKDVDTSELDALDSELDEVDW